MDFDESRDDLSSQFVKDDDGDASSKNIPVRASERSEDSDDSVDSSFRNGPNYKYYLEQKRSLKQVKIMLAKPYKLGVPFYCAYQDWFSRNLERFYFLNKKVQKKYKDTMLEKRKYSKKYTPEAKIELDRRLSRLQKEVKSVEKAKEELYDLD